MYNGKDLRRVSKVSDANMLDRGTHAASTYDSIIPTRLSYNDNSREEASSNSKDAEDRTNRHGRDDRLIGGVA